MKRLSTGGRIDRSKPLSLKFDGAGLLGFQGDTLASAMLANGVSIAGRSFKYHRPRGVYAAGVEEPGAMVHLRDGNCHEPNARATVTEAFDGLVSSSQNAWPSVQFDISEVNDLLSPFLSAGFYYKTFIGPFKNTTKFWMMCETVIRKAAGMGRGTHLDDPDSYEKINAFCDVLVIGGGVAGLSAALAAGRSGASVILVEQDFELGGAILSEQVGGEGDAWLAEAKAELQALDTVRILTRTTAFGAYDGDVYGLVERVSDHLKAPEQHQPRQRYWQVNAKRAIQATGAIERPLVFGGNDRPGVMLAGAARTYLNRYAVLPGQNVVVSTNNDSAYAAAVDLATAGASVTLADMRADVPMALRDALKTAGVTLLLGHGVIEAKGRKRVSSAKIVPIGAGGRATGTAKSIACDLVAVSGGWSPALHLWSQLYKKAKFEPEMGCFVPNQLPTHSIQSAGTVMAAGSVEDVIGQGFEQGQSAAKFAGAEQGAGAAPSAFRTSDFWGRDLHPAWAIVGQNGKTQGKAFVDFQHDVKLSDIDQAHQEGYVSVEHLKRYTTLGMATDQGKLANINALSRMADLAGKTIPEVGTTTFRPPFTPITVGALVGHDHGRHFRPTRLTPIHDIHLENGAQLTEAGAWMRPWYYPNGDEDLSGAYRREAAHVRAHVGMIDVSTLGKIAVQGPDAAEFLNRIYVNGWKTLAVGRLRYGVMLREDGFVMDDGATARLGEHDYFMSTTTTNAARVLAFAEHLLQTAWKDLRVHVTSLTDQWAAIAVAGPNARKLLTAVSDADLSREAMPNNHFTEANIGGVPIRIHRMSYSGELAYEVYIPAGFGQHVWTTIADAGAEFNLKPYGTEAMGALRIEKGHVAGPELEGRTTLKDLGLAGFASSKKPFVGSVLRNRPVLDDSERPTLVGLEIEGKVGAKAGALIFPEHGEPAGHGEGWVSSTTYSPALQKYIALALLKNGKQRKGETVRLVNFVANETMTAKVVSPHFYDPEGVRQNA
ncbi:MAG: sarcosine oxidase subunit alpha family protein [Cognatishimia sp.]